ncbi:Nif3-like dinuclear metal center hexameric protein [Halorubrum vacuolatum]|uniref:Dinuclear metal center protein, YbgI/SA1388 family n=1 Tax=Halorubrum vacuolatum TaxID=63740 RepID=A0A238UUH6_HALVU|nr:Nif3-like dinuclear metal center hexameric protein [Halorubrum vacuolatum]SNR25387.1 dinuclear metal center protein, YbgI/SA1388 family [Halorubrum vacuolatum]
MDRSEYVRRLDERLETDAYADVDASANGLQVGSVEGELDHVAFAVDAAAATIREAAAADADVLVTHHGISWGGIERVTGRTYDRIAALAEADMGLYVSHLPLDGHATLGNAAGVIDAVDFEDAGGFGALGPVTIGRLATAAEPVPVGVLRERLDGFAERERPTQVLPFGPDRIERVAVVTGSGVDWLEEAVDVGADALITGEGKQQVYHDAREAGITVFLAGHYATETFGVRALEALTAEWGIETTYVSHPTGL